MVKVQNEVWGFGYIDLYLIYFLVVLKYIDFEECRYFVSSSYGFFQLLVQICVNYVL